VDSDEDQPDRSPLVRVSITDTATTLVVTHEALRRLGGYALAFAGPTLFGLAAFSHWPELFR